MKPFLPVLIGISLLVLQPSGTVAAGESKKKAVTGIGKSRQVPAIPSSLSLHNHWYTADTSGACAQKDISATGTSISPSEFFDPPHPVYSNQGDDGTAGPFDIGGPFNFNGGYVRYAWVGVNGAIALTASATDTMDINVSGLIDPSWTIPNGLQHNGRGDLADTMGIPSNFIAPFYNDLWLFGPEPIDTTQSLSCGRILTQRGYSGDSCLFTVEWDSVGYFDNIFGPTCSPITFRVVLNRCDGSIEYQYSYVGSELPPGTPPRLDTTALVGIEKDSSGVYPGDWILVNRHNSPVATTPRNNWCVRFSHTNSDTASVSLKRGWNLLSVPLTVSDYSKAVLFPTSTSSAYSYAGTYALAPVLANGLGYWLDFDSAESVRMTGIPRDVDTFSVVTGWNLVGSISSPVNVENITSDPPGIVTGEFWGHNGVYVTSQTIEPGLGYWVNAHQGGKLILSSPGMVPAIGPSSRIRIVPTHEQPPPAPGPNVEQRASNIPANYSLDQNFPNPFNPTTVIKFQLPVTSMVTLDVYDLLGRHVRTLVNGILESGYMAIDWNATNDVDMSVPSGVYFYRLSAVSVENPGKTFNQVNRLLLVK